jgi:hypothetical protein
MYVVIFFIVQLNEAVRLHFNLFEAKMDRISAFIDKMSSQMEPAMSMIDKRLLSLESTVSQVAQDIQGLKRRQDMLFIEQDHIQSTLTGDVPKSSLRSPSVETAVAWSPPSNYLFTPTLPIYSGQQPSVIPSPFEHAVTTASSVPQSVMSAPLVSTPAATQTQGTLGKSHIYTSVSEPADLDLHSVVSIDDIESFFSIDWTGPQNGNTSQTALSQTGCPLSNTAAVGSCPSHSGVLSSENVCQNVLPESKSMSLPFRSYSHSLMDPTVVLQGLRPLTPGYSTVGRIGVALARFSYCGDDILKVSTLKGTGKKHAALDVHKLEALYSFLHRLEPFRFLSKKEFDLIVKGKVVGAISIT